MSPLWNIVRLNWNGSFTDIRPISEGGCVLSNRRKNWSKEETELANTIKPRNIQGVYISCYPGCSKIICFSIDKDKIWKICYLCFSGPGVLPKFCLEGCRWNVIQCYLANSLPSKLNYRDIQTDRQKPFGDLKGRAGLVNTKIGGVLGKRRVNGKWNWKVKVEAV